MVVAVAASSWKPIPARMLSLGSDGKADTLGQQAKAVHIMHRTNRRPERAARARPFMVVFGFCPRFLTAARSLSLSFFFLLFFFLFFFCGLKHERMSDLDIYELVKPKK